MNLDNEKIGANDELPEVEEVLEGQELAEQSSSWTNLGGLGDFLRTPTGAGAIDDYIDHPLNFDNSKGLAQVLRGLTGIFDNLALAVVDIGVGLMRWKKGRGVNA